MLKENKTLNAITGVVQIAVSLSTFAVVKAIIKNNVADPETKTSKVALAVGSYALSAMVANKAEGYVERQLKGLTTEAEKVIDSVKQNSSDS